MTMGTCIAVTKDGSRQELDTPENLCDEPANMFVAGLIGSPAINFFDATVPGSHDDLWLDAGSFKLPVLVARREELSGYAGKSVVFGLRPEDINDRD